MLRTGYGLVILVLFALVMGGCSSSNSDAPLTTQVHPDGWLAMHPADPGAQGDAADCALCHGVDFTGSGLAVSCFDCHASGPPFSIHPAWWLGNAYDNHRHFHNEVDPAQRLNWTTCAAALCHGPDLRGGSGNAPSCFSTNFTSGTGVTNTCHATGPPVPPIHEPAATYALPENHGAAAKDSGGFNLSMGNYCINCHGRPTNQFDGGYPYDPAIVNNPNSNCSNCHPDATAHPTNWVRANNPLYFHSTVSDDTINGSCALCHRTTGPGTGPFAGAPSCFSTSFTNANGLTNGCHDTGPGGAGHILPFLDPALHGVEAKADLTSCQVCHATAGGAGTNPQFNVPIGDLPNGCETAGCHDPGTAHPAGVDRWTFQFDTSGVRRTHFASGNVLTACKLCHNVEVGDTGGAAPACTGCHATTNPFTLDCAACHGNPPGAADPLTGVTPVDHGLVPLVSHTQCSRCHGASDDGTGVLTPFEASYLLFDRAIPAQAQGGDHLDGYIEMNGPAPTTGAGYNATTWTCENAGCHPSGGLFVLSDSTLPLEFGNYGNGGDAGCATCHAYPPDGITSVAPIPVDHTGVSDLPAFLTAHNDCVTCHGDKDDGTGAHTDATYHQDGSLQLNSAVGYNQATFSCDAACHSNAAPFVMSDSGLPIALVDFGGGCDSCHTDGTNGAPVVIIGTTPHTSETTCEACHTGHGTAGSVLIPNNPTVGINYSANGEAGISLGGSATTGTTEAEICWNCHASSGVSEWGLNTDTNGAAGANYNFGDIYTSLAATTRTQNWVGAYWKSAQAKFAYKTGQIRSTHSVNPDVTVAGVDAVADIRCSYCHDVHNTMGPSGKPYLRGAWMGNPYREDGAPQVSDSWTTNRYFGPVPRGGTQSTEYGGYQIDQNNSDPTSGWTLAASAGLCTLCHGSNVDDMNQFGTASAAWVGSNGHSNAVIGGTGSKASNIFNIDDAAMPLATRRNPSGAPIYTTSGEFKGYPRQAYGNAISRGYGFRSQDSGGFRLYPRVTNSQPYAYNDYNWGASVDNTLDIQYHNFSCSKCHNPHASRLPRLMITNCLDTKHNTWDDQGGTAVSTLGTTTTYALENRGVTFAMATSAQNCHRLADTANYSNATGDGWNYVTPWTTEAGGPDNGVIP